MSRLGSLGHKLYSGEVSYDFVGHRKRWYITSGVLILISLGALIVNGLNFSVEFTGGSVFQVTTQSVDVEKAREVVADAGVDGAVVQKVNADRLRVETEKLTSAERSEVATKLATAFKVPTAQVDVQFVSPSWGKEITKKAVYGLVFFLIALVIFLTIYFEFKMAIAAIIATLHDVLLTIGVYALLGIEVSPATVVGILTILGYSLYDTVVVFDKVRENAKGLAGGSRATYSQSANLAVNQTLVRSINTTIVALLPVAAILFGGAILLGAGTLKDLSVALFVGMAAGAYSSIFIATPILCDLKEQEPEMKALKKRVEQRQAGLAAQAKRKGGGTAVLERDGDDSAEAAGDAAAATPAGGVKSTGPRNQPARKKRPGGKKR